MGDKRPSIRKLSSGEKVVHYPSGEQHLLPTGKTAKLLAAMQDGIDRHAQELADSLMRAIADKRDSLEAGDPVPDDKRPV